MNRLHSVSSVVCVICSLILTLGAWGVVEAVGYPFADDFEGGLGNWTADSPWGDTTAFYSSPAHSATDSPSTLYGTWVDASLTLGSSIDLTSATRPVLRFYHRYQIEDGYDFGHIEVSTDGGSTWDAPVATYTGARAQWFRDQIDLAVYAGYPNVRIRFRLVSDGTVNQDGWYIDDVVIADGPAPVTLDTPVLITPNSVDLYWVEYPEVDFAAYRIYRSSTADFDWRTATLVEEIDDPADTDHVDITVTPKTTYYYKVMVLTTSDLHGLSEEVDATTPAGMDFPFLDDGEATGTAWSADPPWALSDEDAFSGNHSWSDSPGADYANSISSQSLTLVSPIDLSSASQPVLSFLHNWSFAVSDSGNVEISTDGGSSWTPLASYTNGSSNGWQRKRFDLSTYAWSNNVLVRFRITTDAVTGADGWHVDDISVAESPTVVDPPILDQVTSNSIRLTWARSNDTLFSHYAIHRSTTPGVGINSVLVAEISAQDTTTFTDTGLAVDTDYYYRVYAVSPYGTYSPDSVSDSTRQTGGNPYPFADDFEGSLESWNLGGSWNSTDTDQHGGSRSLTDSPGTTYDYSTTSARTSIDISGSTWPVLRFWDRFAFADGDDWGLVEVSPDGSTWSRVYSATATRTAWAEQSIDLSPWKTASNLRIRFTLTASTTGFDDGWYIDDLSVADHVGGAVPLPFFDDFESGTGNWLTSAWDPTAAGPHAGTWTAQSTPQGSIYPHTEHSMELAGSLDLTSASNPQLTYWLRGAVAYYAAFRAQVSIDRGVNWADLPDTAFGESSVPAWRRYQISLAAYPHSDVRIRFLSQGGRYGGATNILIDDVSIEDMPQPVTLAAPVPHLKSVDLSWTESALGDFNRYEVYRSTTANVTTASTFLFSSATSTDTTFTDTGLSIGATYYYRVFVFNSRHVATPSTERAATTVPLTFPFADPMENLDNWDSTGTWGPDGTSPYEGAFSLNDSPGDNSPLNSNTYILTAVNLSGSTWPVLRFFDRADLADDWGFLDVSPDGSTWSRVYSSIATRTAWAEQSIDLSPWKTATNLRIRFNVSTGGANFDEGWYIDDLSVADHVGGAVPLPFFDDFESGTGNWLTSAWDPTAAGPHAGTWTAQSTPQGSIYPHTEHSMELAGSLDLTSASNPQLTYWLRGAVAYYAAFRAQVSIDRGVNWADLPDTAFGESSVPAWRRYQISLAAYPHSDVRIRFLSQGGKYGGATNILIDDVSIEDMPQPVTLAAPVPHLKSVDLSWTESALGDFNRYEVYRSTTANVTTASTFLFSSATSTDTTFTDTGLSIGATYYYRVFVFNSRHVATPSTERAATTVPLTFPFADPMENLDNWDSTGTWGPDGTSPYEGAFSLNDSPGDNSPLNSNTYILTAVNLSGSTWPVLRFFDRADLADDWGFLDVSPDGSTWSRVYSATATRTAWAEQSIDLSPWKTATNLRIRFNVSTGGANFDEGWYIDDLSVADHVGGAVPLPFFDDFESGTGNWLTSAWDPTAAGPHAGTWTAQSTPQGSIYPHTEHSMELAGSLDLTSASNPQLTYWLRGAVAYYAAFRAQVSIDRGVNWADLPDTAFGESSVPAWRRYQISLAAYPHSDVRIRFLSQGGRHGGATNILIDDVSIEDMPPTLTLATPDQVTISSMRLRWNDLDHSDFKAYAIYRSETATVDTSSTLIETITEQTATEFVDTGLQARRTYNYRVYLVDTRDTYSPSNSSSAMTLGLPLSFTDDFESDSGVWTFTGQWGRVEAEGLGDSFSLGDSPGDFVSSSDTWAVTGVDLSATNWPVLAFNDRYDLPGSHWGRLEISSNSGASWTLLYGANGTQTGWVARRFDLSPWRNQGQVWIRFRLAASSSAPADGWHIDHLTVSENPIAGSLSYPFFDGLEGGAGSWLNGQWASSTDNPYQGTASILSTAGDRLGYTENWLVLGDEFDLSTADDPLLTYQVRGSLPYHAYFRVDLSTDGGLNWQELSALNLNEYWTSSTWVRKQISLAGYKVANLRLRFRITGSGGGAEDIFLDNISIGEQTPAAPTLNSPAMGNSEPTVRPTLTVNNAVEYQSDPLTYHYQVFDDAELTHSVAEVPVIAGGVGTTSWTVDVSLLPDTQYWWRCRATDDSAHTGPWMETATFFVQLTDHPPTVPVLLGPSDGGQLPDLSGRLTWLESTDPDEDNGDYVSGYRVQVDDDPAFGSIEIDEPSVALTTKATGAISVSLSELTGAENLVLERRYYWRVNAKDSHGGASAWSDGPAHFVFGSDETAPACSITFPTDDATVTGTPISVAGTANDDLSGVGTIEISTDGGTTWVQAVGAESWSHQWWPAFSGDYTLSCRATDTADNAGDESTPITTHADLDRTMSLGEATATVNEDAGTYNVTVTLNAARATEVTAELVVSGSAASGADFDEPPQIVRFFPGQTTLVFPLTITDDDQVEGNETISLALGDTNISDVTIGAVGSLTLTIVDNDVMIDPNIFADGFEEHGDLSAWSAHAP